MRNRYVLFGDLVLIALAVFLAFAVRFDWRFYQYRLEFPAYLAAALIVRPIVFHVFGLYRRLWRYASVAELLATAMAVFFSSLALVALVAGGLVLRPRLEFSRAVILLDALLTLVFLGGLRMSVRVIAERRRLYGRGTPGERRRTRVLIAGAGQAGVLVLRELQSNPQLPMTAVGFLDDDETKVGKVISGVSVLGTLKALPDVVRRHGVNEVIIAMPTAPGSMLRALADACREQGVTSKTIPGVFELLHGRVEISRLRHVDISDLLRRSPVSAPLADDSYVSGRVVLVTGAGGSIGSELCRQVAAAGPSRLVLLGHGENSLFEAQNELRVAFPNLPMATVIADVRNRARLDTVFRRHRPRVVFHAAAHKHVPLLEDNAEEAITNNVRGTKNVVDASLAAGVERLVMISTDKAASPANVMGASKRLAEMCVRDAASRHGVSYVVVRFGNVLGSRGSVVPFFKRQIERGGPVTVTHPEMTRFFMTIPEAVHLVLQAGGMGKGGELYVLDMGQPVKIVDLARDLISLSGLTEQEIPIVFTGIRPGEKLDERLYEEGAQISHTSCTGIMRVVEPNGVPDAPVERMVESVVAACAGGDRMQIEAELARWIPSYVPDLTPQPDRPTYS